MKKTIFLIFIISLSGFNLSAKPLAGVATISWNTQRGMIIASLLEEHATNTLKKDNTFDTINSGIINRELSKFNCFEETCLQNFAEKAEINLLITGDIQDFDNYFTITLKSYGINQVMNGKLIYSLSVRVPLRFPIGSREFSLICEEHASSFILQTVNLFRQDIKIVKAGDSYTALTEYNLTGTYSLFKKDINGRQVRTGFIILKNNTVTSYDMSEIPQNSYIIVDLKNHTSLSGKYYTEKKHEIVFPKKSFYDTLYVALITPFASAMMPVASPFLGYYMNNDWSGLGLWMVNAPPYLYMEARGFINSPSKLREKKENISRDDKAINYFAWYMAAAGGLPLFIDSYAHTYLEQASYYTGDTRLLGNNATAVYLSLVSNGGGMFYRGNRPWGYFYFHLNNILLYSTLREFAKPEKYNPSTEHYEKGSSGKRKKMFCSVLAISKITEILHTAFTPDNIRNGEIIDEYVLPSPLLTIDDNNNPQYGITVSFFY